MSLLLFYPSLKIYTTCGRLLNINAAAYQIPSIEKLILLYNNYFVEASQNEVYSGQERIEENNLLDVMLTTPVMQFARSFLVRKGAFPTLKTASN